MTKEMYILLGYRVSINIDQALIDRAERDVYDAYIAPILPSSTIDDEEITVSLMELAYVRMCAIANAVVTKSGTKEKTSASSVSADYESIAALHRPVCKMRIEALRLMPSAIKDAKVNDILKLYYKTKFFSI